MLSRREFLKALGLLMLSPALAPFRALAAEARPGLKTGGPSPGEVWVNDIHSQLNRTRVAGILKVNSRLGAMNVVRQARKSGEPLAVCGGRHAGGGQQFLSQELLVDTTSMNQVLSFDRTTGLIEAEAGIEWPELMAYLEKAQTGNPSPTRWGIRQKQTGADKLTLGGAIASNVHSRGLGMKPLISDIEAIKLINAEGKLITCSRTENPELFSLVNGGYGLFGLVYSATLRLVPRRKVRRVVRRMTVDELVPAIETVQQNGALYGDFQFSIDNPAPDFLTGGIMATYEPVPDETPMTERPGALSLSDWIELVTLAHTDKTRAFEKYTRHYLETDGRIYWSDTHQMGPYRDYYHQYLDRERQSPHPGSEAITELYVPRDSLECFMCDAREDFRKHDVDVIYGTVRFIRRDDESFLPWARQDYACIIFNLHTEHTPEGIAQSADTFRRLIDYAIRHGGSYYLTYHRFARKDQVLACYPQFPAFLQKKLAHDPEERFQSDWYRHYRQMFRDELAAL